MSCRGLPVTTTTGPGAAPGQLTSRVNFSASVSPGWIGPSFNCRGCAAPADVAAVPMQTWLSGAFGGQAERLVEGGDVPDPAHRDPQPLGDPLQRLLREPVVLSLYLEQHLDERARLARCLSMMVTPRCPWPLPDAHPRSSPPPGSETPPSPRRTPASPCFGDPSSTSLDTSEALGRASPDSRGRGRSPGAARSLRVPFPTSSSDNRRTLARKKAWYPPPSDGDPIRSICTSSEGGAGGRLEVERRDQSSPRAAPSSHRAPYSFMMLAKRIPSPAETHSSLTRSGFTPVCARSRLQICTMLSAS